MLPLRSRRGHWGHDIGIGILLATNCSNWPDARRRRIEWPFYQVPAFPNGSDFDVTANTVGLRGLTVLPIERVETEECVRWFRPSETCGQLSFCCMSDFLVTTAFPHVFLRATISLWLTMQWKNVYHTIFPPTCVSSADFPKNVTWAYNGDGFADASSIQCSRIWSAGSQ